MPSQREWGQSGLPENIRQARIFDDVGGGACRLLSLDSHFGINTLSEASIGNSESGPAPRRGLSKDFLDRHS